MRRQTAAGLSVAALSLLLVAARPFMREEDWMDGLDAPFGWILIPGVTPRNLAANVEGLTDSLEQSISYAAKRRGQGMENEPDAERDGLKVFKGDHDLLVLYAGWLADAVERMPEAKDWQDDVVFRPSEVAEGEWKKRLPVAGDFYDWEKSLSSHKFQHKKLEPAALEFSSAPARGRRR